MLAFMATTCRSPGPRRVCPQAHLRRAAVGPQVYARRQTTCHDQAATIAVRMTGGLEAAMIRWGFPVFAGALIGSALLLRRWPLAALAVTLAGSVGVMLLLPDPVSPELVVLAVAVGLEICYLAATRPPRVSVPGAVLACAGLLIPLLVVPALGSLGGGTMGSGGPSVATLVVLVVTVIAWLIGFAIRQAQSRAELLRAQAAGQAALAERLRIARELHDMVAHSIGIIAIQAGSGRSVFEARPGEALEALAAIETASRETLSGLRRLVTGLRRAESASGPGSGQAPLGPAPGLADLDRLVATAGDAGVRIELDVDWRGRREPLPPDIDLSTFRIIQEAVTNVVSHAGTDQCRVSIGFQDGQLSIEVTDSGRGGRAAGAGYGITGMRERAALLGGDLSAGPRPGGGFRVAARLPVPAPVPLPGPAPIR
jgi:signal transduction histidine kinase